MYDGHRSLVVVRRINSLIFNLLQTLLSSGVWQSEVWPNTYYVFETELTFNLNVPPCVHVFTISRQLYHIRI